MTEQKRRPGRPAKPGGPDKTRSIRIGPIWDRAAELAPQHGTTITTIITRALEDYVMSIDTTQAPQPSPATRDAIAALAEATIQREYGAAVDLAALRRTASTLLAADLRDDYVMRSGDDWGLLTHADLTLRARLAELLATRVCQCRQLYPRGCPHGSPRSGDLWCTSHYEADVPELGGALLCGTCHVTEYQTRGGE